MDAMYALLMTKKWHQTEPFLTPTLVNYYLQETIGRKDNASFPYKINVIVIFPGYLSKSESNIENFWSNFFNNVDSNFDCIIAKGMNENSKKSSGDTLEENFEEIKKYTKSDPLLIPSSKDHSKSIFFLQSKDDSFMDALRSCLKTIPLDSIFGKEDNVSKENKEHDKELLKKYKVEFNKKIFKSYIKENFEIKAILVGSSNLSYQTYYKSPADKGEKDVFLFDAKNERMARKFKAQIMKKCRSFSSDILLFKEVEKIDLHKIMSDEIDELESYYEF